MYEALRACEHPWYVASSKAAHRISPLLRALLGVDMDTASPRLFAGLIPPNERKIAALRCAWRDVKLYALARSAGHATEQSA